MPMDTIALIVGFAAVFFFLLSFQFPKRHAIITCNVVSRMLYILQYLLLLAFEGAVMDISAIPSSVLAARKNTAFVKKHRIAILIFSNAVVIGLGLLVWRSWLSVIPVVGVLFETNALWMTEERRIRRYSLAALPFWLFYNLSCGAYGAAFGNVLAAGSILAAMLRYDFPKNKTAC